MDFGVLKFVLLLAVEYHTVLVHEVKNTDSP